MTAKELVETLIKEGLPPEGWGRWVWKGPEGYGLSALVTGGTLPPVEEGETPLFWWGGVRKSRRRCGTCNGTTSRPQQPLS